MNNISYEINNKIDITCLELAVINFNIINKLKKIADKIIVALLIGNIYNTSSIPAKPLHCMLNYGGFFFAREVL